MKSVIVFLIFMSMLATALIMGCTQDQVIVEDLEGLREDKSGVTYFKNAQDTFLCAGVQIDVDSFELEWSVKKYQETRYRGIFKWQGPEYLPFEEAMTVFFKVGYSEVDFLKVASNDGNLIRGNIQVKYPACISSKEDAEKATEKIYQLLLSEITPIHWVIIQQDCN